MTPNILADFTISKALPLALRETVSKLLSRRKSILSSALHLSESTETGNIKYEWKFIIELLHLLGFSGIRKQIIQMEHNMVKNPK